MENKKILVIDMNCIMAACLPLYADRINPDENITVSWNMLESRYGLEKFLCVDTSILFRIADILKQAKSEITFLNSSKELPPLIVEPSEITSVDFFDDFSVSADELAAMDASGKFNSQNWARFLYMCGKMPSFTWINFPKSIGDFPPVGMMSSDNLFVISEKDADISGGKFDRIFVCDSPYIPEKFRYIFDLFKTIFGGAE